MTKPIFMKREDAKKKKRAFRMKGVYNMITEIRSIL